MNRKRLSKLVITIIFLLFCWCINQQVSAAVPPPPVPSSPLPVPNILEYFDVPSLSSASNSAYPDNYYQNKVVITEDNVPDQFGVMWGKPLLDLKQDFEIESYVYLYSSTNPSKPADGLTFTLQGDPRGGKAYGTVGWGLGAYGYPASSVSSQKIKIDNALVFEMDTYWNSNKSETNVPTNGMNSWDIGTEGASNYSGHIAIVETNKDNRIPQRGAPGFNSTGGMFGDVYHRNIQTGSLAGSSVSQNKWQKMNFTWKADTRVATYTFGDFQPIYYQVNNLQETFGGQYVKFGYTGSTGGAFSDQCVAFMLIPGAPVHIHYVDLDTNQKLESSITLRGNLGYLWESEYKDFTGYEFIRVEGPIKGTFVPDEQQVTYYYQKPKGVGLNIKKVSSKNNQALVGAKFKLIQDSDGSSAYLVDQENGQYTLPDGQRLSYGQNYTLVEAEAPEGHVLPEKHSWQIVIDSGGKITIDGESVAVVDGVIQWGITNNWKNIPIAVKKYGLGITSNELPLAGAEFQLFRQDENGLLVATKKSVSSTEGLAKFTIEQPGTYLIKEISGPLGYDTRSGNYKFTVDSYGRISYENHNVLPDTDIWTIMHENSIKPFNLNVRKKDENGKMLPGAHFLLEGENLSVTLPTKDEDQMSDFLFTNLVPGKYTLTESQSPPGYKGLKEPIQLEITVEGKVLIDEKNYPVELKFGNDANLITLDIENKSVPFVFWKVDEEGQAMKDVTFDLFYCLNKELNHQHESFTREKIPECWQLKDTTMSQVDGQVVFRGLSEGTYILVETKTNAGYELPTGYWQINYNPSKELLQDQVIIVAKGEKLPPAFMIEKVDNKEMLKLPNHQLTSIPATGSRELLLSVVLGIIMLGIGGVYFVQTSKSKNELL